MTREPNCNNNNNNSDSDSDSNNNSNSNSNSNNNGIKTSRLSLSKKKYGPNFSPFFVSDFKLDGGGFRFLHQQFFWKSVSSYFKKLNFDLDGKRNEKLQQKNQENKKKRWTASAWKSSSKRWTEIRSPRTRSWTDRNLIRWIRRKSVGRSGGASAGTPSGSWDEKRDNFRVSGAEIEIETGTRGSSSPEPVPELQKLSGTIPDLIRFSWKFSKAKESCLLDQNAFDIYWTLW